MFTGLIESVGRIAAVEAGASGFRLRVETPLAADLRLGDSIAVNGVCLTASAIDGGAFLADVGPETARVTTLGTLGAGSAVNLERAMRGDARFGGHFVQGHVDATATIEGVREDGDAHWITIGFDPDLAPYLVAKGSVAVDGISLTVARLEASTFDVMIIPFTWTHTNLSAAREGTRVNIECDLVGKYVVRAAAMYRT
ncbi:MAG TPA: riboflavin synthase [Vicinamibacterales bacterium]|nr:riboflavin synthase [Vicinamibacterales bacterium]